MFMLIIPAEQNKYRFKYIGHFFSNYIDLNISQLI